HGEDIWGGPPGSAEEDGDRFIEIWNLVFMQFNQTADGRENLPKPSIDTGMGLERVAAVLQGKHNNYETDLFQALISAEEEIYKVASNDENIGSFRVIADHLRTSAFLIADGVSPSNEGRGYVLRRIMRRAMRHGHILGATEPKMFQLTDTLIKEMGGAYPEIGRAAPAIKSELEQEEARFQRTLGRGMSILETAVSDLNDGEQLPGDVAFKLYDTYGFPLDLTEDILRGQERTVDTGEFDRLMDIQKSGGKDGPIGKDGGWSKEVWFALLDELGETKFTGYSEHADEGKLVAILSDGAQVSAISAGPAELVFDQTPFYAESGGQSGDHGEIRFENGARFVVRDVQKRAGKIHAHIGELVEGEISLGEKADLVIDEDRRRRIKANHSATHLVHKALRSVLGEHVTQKGSLVEADRFRFDFSHNNPVTAVELEAIEEQVNRVICDNAETTTRHMNIDAAIESGALALFGEKYDDEVRVLTMGREIGDKAAPYSVELCGGTHVERTGDIGTFVILSESGVSAGIRRIEATTGLEALGFLKSRAQIAVDLADQLKVPVIGVQQKVSNLMDERKKLDRELVETRKQLAMGGAGKADSGPETIGEISFIGKVAQGVPAKDLRSLVDEAKTSIGSGVVIFVGVNDGKAGVTVGVTKDLTDKVSAVDLVRLASAALGGKGGGGRPDMAQAGGPNGADADKAVDAVRQALSDL
ncbi:MAG: alanine--tRNA ligase, partial [Pseudomonadota bacterium]